MRSQVLLLCSRLGFSTLAYSPLKSLPRFRPGLFRFGPEGIGQSWGEQAWGNRPAGLFPNYPKLAYELFSMRTHILSVALRTDSRLFWNNHPAQLALMFGRRQVGKSELLLQWVDQSGLPFTYWGAVEEEATQQRTRLFGKLLNVPASFAPVYHSWPELWDATAPFWMSRSVSFKIFSML